MIAEDEFDDVCFHLYTGPIFSLDHDTCSCYVGIGSTMFADQDYTEDAALFISDPFMHSTGLVAFCSL